MPRSLGVIGCYFISMCLLPLFCVLEGLVRGRSSILFLKDVFLEFVVSANLMITLVMQANIYVFSVFLLSLVVFAAGLLLRFYHPRSRFAGTVLWLSGAESSPGEADRVSLRLARGIGAVWRVLVLLNVAVAVQVASTIWWWFVVSWPTTAAAGGLLSLLFFFVLPRSMRARPAWWWAGLCLFAGVLHLSSILVLRDEARVVPARQLSAEPAYDVLALPDGKIFATFRYAPAKTLADGRWLAIDDVAKPDRFAFDARTRKAYLGNKFFSVDEPPTGSVICRKLSFDTEYEANWMHYPAISVATNKLFLVYEGGLLVVVDLATSRLDLTRWKEIHFYGAYVDDRRWRVYLVGSLLNGRISVMDTGTYAIVDRRWIGWSVFGAALNERTGDLWITRGEANEVLVLDPQLQPVAKIGVGIWPRDIRIDRVRGRVFVGNYLSGTVTIIDLNAKKVLATLRPSRGPADQWWLRAFFTRLSGLFVDRQGNLYVADGKGIFEVDAAQITAVVDQMTPRRR